jgi:hypothetical protein
MKLGFRLLNLQRLGALIVILHAASAVAQDTAAPAPPEAPAPATTTAVAPPPAPSPSEVPASVVNEPTLAPPAPLPPTPAEPPPLEVVKTPEEDPPPLNVSMWGRVDFQLTNSDPANPPIQPTGDKLDDVYSTADFQLHMSGKVYGVVSFTANFVATYNPDIQGTVSFLDGIIQIEPSDYFNIWVGRMLVPVDRANFSGYWFAAPWYYPGFGFADGQVGAPREGPFGRNNGVTVWGQIDGGLVKYYAGAYNLHDVSTSPLFSGRLAVALLDKEPGYYHSSTYYGKDILTIAVGAQAQKDGSAAPIEGVAPDNYTEFNADVLFEKNFPGAGVLDLEGAFYKFNGDFEPTDAHWLAVASYLLPNDIGPGKLQPLVRVQQAIPSANDADTSTLIDAQIGYVVNSYATRFALGYRTGSAGDLDVQALYIGAQFLK